jgi:hypothetical protein
MRVSVVAVSLLAVAAAIAASNARADTGPVIVIPGKPGVPVMINGRDASYGVVEGDWGLGKSINVQPTVTNSWRAISTRPEGQYFPRTGRLPGYGRYEIEPPENRKLPPRAQSFHRAWGVESPNVPVTQNPPYEPPQIMIDPRPRYRGSEGEGDGGRRRAPRGDRPGQ